MMTCSATLHSPDTMELSYPGQCPTNRNLPNGLRYTTTTAPLNGAGERTYAPTMLPGVFVSTVPSLRHASLCGALAWGPRIRTWRRSMREKGAHAGRVRSGAQRRRKLGSRPLRPRHVLPRRLRQLLGPGPDLPLVRPLEHDPQLGLGAAPADEHATVLAEGRLHHLRRPRQVEHLLEGPPGGKREVLEHLGDAFHGRAGQLRERLPGADHEGQDLQRADQPVPGRRVVEEDQVAGLLAA